MFPRHAVLPLRCLESVLHGELGHLTCEAYFQIHVLIPQDINLSPIVNYDDFYLAYFKDHYCNMQMTNIGPPDFLRDDDV